MFAFIQFNSKFAGWSAFSFWVVVVSIMITLGFTVVVFFGGIGDLKFLLRSMDEPLSPDSNGLSTSESSSPAPKH
jgi:hypothetical protein